MMILGTALALAAPRMEVHGVVGASVHLGRTATNLGVGGGGGLRLESGPLGADATAQLGFGLAPVVDTRVGLDLTAPYRSWRPAIGVELGGLWGTPIRFADSTAPRDPVRNLVLGAVRLRLHPLVFRREDVTVRLLGLAYGPGLGGPAHSVSIEGLRLSWRLTG